MSPLKRPQPVEPWAPPHAPPGPLLAREPPTVKTDNAAPAGGSVGTAVASLAPFTQSARVPADASSVVPTMYQVPTASAVAPVSAALPLSVEFS